MPAHKHPAQSQRRHRGRFANPISRRLRPIFQTLMPARKRLNLLPSSVAPSRTFRQSGSRRLRPVPRTLMPPSHAAEHSTQPRATAATFPMKASRLRTFMPYENSPAQSPQRHRNHFANPGHGDCAQSPRHSSPRASILSHNHDYFMSQSHGTFERVSRRSGLRCKRLILLRNLRRASRHVANGVGSCVKASHRLHVQSADTP